MTIEVLVDPPGHGRLPDEDEEIIDRAVTVKGWSGRRIQLVTMDTGTRLRASMVDLDVVKINQQFGEEPLPTGTKKTRPQTS